MIALFEPGGEPVHYMGYLVLQSSDSKRFDIIDGQQRITTTGKHIGRRDRNLEGGLSLAAIVTEENTIYTRTVFWNPTATKK